MDGPAAAAGGCAQLAAATNTSATSSKPPSSDIVKPKPKRKHCKRRRGALEDHGFEVGMQATDCTPRTSEAQNLAKRFGNHGKQYIQFITTPEIDPTNILAEQPAPQAAPGANASGQRSPLAPNMAVTCSHS